MAHKIDIDTLGAVAREVLDVSMDGGQRLTAVIERLSAAFPGLIEDGPHRRWIGTKAGGILGKITLLHVSLTEYLLLFGAPTPTCGFSGRYNYVDITKTIVAGQVNSCDLESDQIDAQSYWPGDQARLAKGSVRSLEITGGTWLLEYGRGPVITTVPFGVMDSVLSSLEIKPLRDAGKEYFKLMTRDVGGRRARADRRQGA